MTPSRMIEWCFLRTGQCWRELVIASDLLAASALLVFFDNWIVTSFAPLQQSFLHDVAELVPSRVQIGVLFTLGMLVLIFDRVRSSDIRRADRGMFVLGCGAIAGFLADMLKIVFGRARPDGAYADTPVAFHFFEGGSGLDSLPSSHAAIAGGLAGALSTMWPCHRGKFYALAAAIAVSRFVSGAHYPSDVLFGFALGLGIVVAIYLVFGSYLQLTPRKN
jgi:membrane-associated phospholipid phosphatase